MGREGTEEVREHGSKDRQEREERGKEGEGRRGMKRRGYLAPTVISKSQRQAPMVQTITNRKVVSGQWLP